MRACCVHAFVLLAGNTRRALCVRAEANWSAENEEVGRVNKRKRDRADSYEMERQGRSSE